MDSPAVNYSPNRIYLIGMMGVGKSTLGKKLANALRFSFVDLDKEIEKAEGKTVEALFEEDGEPYFRQREQACLLQTQRLNHVVIATGGGAPMYGENMRWMNEHGKTVYLKADLSFIVSRVSQNANKRPLLKNKDEKALFVYLTELLQKREPVYQQAFKVFEIPSNTLSDLVKSINERG